MENIPPPFSAQLATQIPFSARATLEQLRFLVKSSHWFNEKPVDSWFDVPASELDAIQAHYNQEWSRISLQTLMLQPFSFTDRRFAGKHWSQPIYGSVASYYLANSGLVMQLFEAMPIAEDRDRRRLRFMLDQLIAAHAPSNFLACNPEALQRSAETQGASLLSGFLHLASDLQEGKLRQCDKAAFELGVDLAVTPGGVVYQNPLFQLIQYAPQSERQYKRPLLLVPPAINKYYLVDLQAKNSLVRYLLEQGHPVFLISWRNADISLADASWDDYLELGVIEAIRTVQRLTGEQHLNAVGYCIGGTLLSSALAVLAARGEHPASSLTLFAAMLDFEDTGEIGLLVDEQMVSRCERTIGGHGGPFGLHRGSDMANLFSMLRPNELWWNYSVDKYLMGQKPRPLDLLYWNNDSTHLPGAFYCWYLRHAYLQNDLKSGKLECCGERLDFGNLKMPAYVVGTREDHIVPWQSAYASTRLLKGEQRFVLGASGHIAGIINHPAANKRSYWTHEEVPGDPDAWLQTAEEHQGSWWPNWIEWLDRHCDGACDAEPRQPGSAEFPVLEAAPGTYVKAVG